MFLLCLPSCLRAQNSTVLWWEAERPIRHTFPPSDAFIPYNAEQREALSDGDWLQTDRAANARISYRVNVPENATFQFWTRKFWKHGPFRWRFNDQPWQTVTTDIDLVDRVVLRTHVEANWVYLGEVTLPAGDAILWIEMLPDAGPAAFDCWVLSEGPFVPNGRLKPGQTLNRADPGHQAFEPPADNFQPTPLDLTRLNHNTAGEHGFVIPQGSDFIYEQSGETVRFWGVNLGVQLNDDASRTYLARRLAKLGVNLARYHGPIWDQRADRIDIDKIHNIILTTEALAEEGIYTTLSFYFPLWLRLHEDPRFPGYRQDQPPFALLFGNRTFQQQHRDWMRALLTTTSPRTGRTLAENPAVAAIEILNEDSLFFWTFAPYDNIPEATTIGLERAFARWLTRKYNNLPAAFDAWSQRPGEVRGDNLNQSRVGLYAAGFLTNAGWARNSRNHLRASDQLAFFLDLQTAFYTETTRYLREQLGVRSAIIGTNWGTADDPTLLPIEKLSNTVTGTMDRHAYIGGRHEGNGASYDLRVDHIYENRSAIGTEIPAVARPEFASLPHIISEYGYPMPNAYRAESIFFAATYGRASGLDAVIFFSITGLDWAKQLDKFTAFTPAIAGQFPAASLIFRNGYVSEAPIVITESITRNDLLNFHTSQLVRPADLDDLRAVGPRPINQLNRDTLTSIAPLLGRTRILPATEETRLTVADDLKTQTSEPGTITSANRELTTDLNRRLAIVNTPLAQGVCGFLANAGPVETDHATFQANNHYASIMLVPLDDQPIATSSQLLLQVATEESTFGWQTQPTDDGAQRITSLGTAPIQFKSIDATLTLKHISQRFRVTTLDPNGQPRASRITDTPTIQLDPAALYTLIEPLEDE
ncbi:hypothetical protein [Mucisphaera sp.]|uniref:hypothetical protein n=1 Tax=Mucisphaera sp. TaxID=2913024 RepID=UPI003D0CBE85